MKKRWCKLLLPILAIAFLFVGGVSVEAAVRQTQASANRIDFSWDAYSSTYSDYQDLYYEVSWGESSSSLTNSGKVNLSTTQTYLYNLPSTAKIYIEVNLVYSYNGELRKRWIGGTYCYTLPGTVTTFSGYDFCSNQKGLEIAWTAPSGNYSPYYEYQILNTSNQVISSGTRYGSSLYLSSYPGFNRVARLRVRPYITANNTTYYGNWSAFKNIVPQPIVKSAKLKSGNAVKITWKKVKGASKYVVYMSKKEKSGYKKITTLSSKKTSYTVKKFKGKKFAKYKNYYYKIVTKTKKYGSSAKNYYNGFYIYNRYR